MFYDRPDCIKLSEKVFVFKNVVPKELTDKVLSQYNSSDQKEFRYDDSIIDWYADKVAPYAHGIHDVWESLSDLLYPEYVMHPSSSVLTVRPGDGGMFIHSDSPGKGCEDMLTQLDEFSTCCVIDYGLVMYMGEWTGGAIFYPNINPDGSVKEDGSNVEGPCLEYTPEPGDVVVHSSMHPYEHGVREVESGVRYAFSNFVLRSDENPGSFYNYKSPEYYEQIGDRSEGQIMGWMAPLFKSPVAHKLRLEHGKPIRE